MRADMIPGARFPDYQLPDHTGRQQKLSQLQGNNPVALLLSRGGYCPKEHLQHVWMTAMQAELKVSYCRFITISTDSPFSSME